MSSTRQDSEKGREQRNRRADWWGLRSEARAEANGGGENQKFDKYASQRVKWREKGLDSGDSETKVKKEGGERQVSSKRRAG